MKLLKFLLPLLIAIVALPLSVWAQVDPNCDPDCPWVPGCPPECIPFDSGLVFLIAAAVGIGAKKAYQRKAASFNP